MSEIGTLRVKTGLAEMLKGGVIMDVVDADQARIAEEAGACAVMALERVPADIRVQGGVARMSDPDKIREIQETVSIPVMAKCRIGHFVEAQILEALEVDYIDESEVLTPADLEHHVDKHAFTVPFVCGCTNLGEALRRIAEGAAMIRTKGEAGTGDIVNAVTHMRAVFGGMRRLQSLREDELFAEAKELRAPVELVRWVAEHGRLPVVTFTAGGIATPADAACACSSAPTASSSAPASSSRGATSTTTTTAGPRTCHAARRRSSRRPRTTPTRRSSPRCPPGSGRRWSASPPRRSPRASGSKSAAGNDPLSPPVNPVRAGVGGVQGGVARIYTFAVTERSPRIGVLALQGAFREHAAVLRAPRRGRSSRCGCREELDGLDGLVIPGGESTTIMRLARLYGLDDAIRSFPGAVLGTCAGMIVLDRRHLDLVDLEVDRNAYGRQVASFEADVELAWDGTPLHGVFIRAPRVRVARRRRRGAGRARRRAGARP